MPGNILSLYGTSNQALTIQLANLPNSDCFIAEESTAVSNAVNLALDALVSVRVNPGTVAGNKIVVVYAYGSVDGGTVYSGNALGCDYWFGLSGTNQCLKHLRMIGIIPTEQNSVACEGGPYSIAQSFGGVLPQSWGIVVQNQSGAALSSTTGNNCAKYQLVSGSYT